MKDFLHFIQQHSLYYRELWNGHELDLVSLPIVDQDAFWPANSWQDNKLLTSDISNGVVFKSGGTTGKPKFSVYTKNEWEEFTRIFGQGMAQVIDDGDRVGNLFYAGELYASFLFIEKSLEYCPRHSVTFPIAGATDLDQVIDLVRTYNINVLAGVPTTFMRLAQLLNDRNETLPLNKILYGGEALFPDQKELLAQAFNKPMIASVGYASVDAGQLGGSEPSLGFGAHKVLAGSIMQIVDEHGELITKPNEPGRMLMTNLTRTLMPIVRYPVGDCAKWIVPGESFFILGRADEGARIGPVTVNRDDIAHVLSCLGSSAQFQLVIKREDSKDLLEIHCQGSLNCNEAFSVLMRERAMLKTSIEKGLIASPVFVQVDELVRNARTGKLRFVIDQRF